MTTMTEPIRTMTQTATSVAIFHCQFSDSGPCQLESHSFEEWDCQSPAHLYAVCAIDDSCQRMICGLLVRTSVSDEQACFLDAMAAVFESVPQLRGALQAYTSMLSVPVGDVNCLPTKKAAMSLFMELWSSHLASRVVVQ